MTPLAHRLASQGYHTMAMMQNAMLQQQLLQAGLLNGQEIRVEGLPADAVGPVATALINLMRHRRGGGNAAQQQLGQQLNAGGGGLHPPRQNRRMLRINVRLSIRTILQVLVFGMVLYQVRCLRCALVCQIFSFSAEINLCPCVCTQHFTFHRFVALTSGGLLLWLAATWGPLRRAIAALQQPPPPPGANRPAAAAAPGVGQPMPEGGNVAAPAADVPAAAPQRWEAPLPCLTLYAQPSCVRLVCQGLSQ